MNASALSRLVKLWRLRPFITPSTRFLTVQMTIMRFSLVRRAIAYADEGEQQKRLGTYLSQPLLLIYMTCQGL